MPTPEQVADIGLSPIRPGGPKPVQMDYKKKLQLQNRIAQREAMGKPHGQADRRLENINRRLNAAKGPSYLPGTAY